MAKKTKRNPQDVTLRNNRARQNEIAELQHRSRVTNDRLAAMKHVVGTAITWIGATAGGPLSGDQAAELLKQLETV